jgi:hypothetical protein
MNYDQYRSLVSAFKETAAKIRLINGLSAKTNIGLTPANRQVALKLNNVFARLVDHSRVGVIEVQSTTADWECPEMKWDGPLGWKQFFQDVGFSVHTTDLQPGQDFALNIAAGGRSSHRKLDPEEEAALEKMQEEARLYKEKVDALNAASEPDPPTDLSTPE